MNCSRLIDWSNFYSRLNKVPKHFILKGPLSISITIIVILMVAGGGIYYYYLQQARYNSSASATSSIKNTYIGIYVATPQITTDSNHTLATSTYALPYINGIAIRIGWNVIEPGNGTYDWSTLDSIVTQAVANSKNISIGIGTGESTPTWLYSEGVPSVTLMQANNDNTDCNSLTVPVPWDPTYEQAYTSMMQALSAHVHSIPGAYDALKVVKITGMNEDSEELIVPPSTPSANSPTCVTDADLQWQAAGFVPSKAVSAWNVFASATNTAFPDKILAQVIKEKSFPPIDEAGTILTARQQAAAVDPRDTMIDSGLAQFSSRFAALFDALAVQGFDSSGPETESVATRGGLAFYQTNIYGGPSIGSECGADQSHGQGTRTLCTESTYKQLLENGLSHHGTYFEIWEADAVAFPQALTAFEAELKSST
jgi:hypothetical protein